MITFSHTSPTATTRVEVAPTATLQDVIETFTRFLLACGYQEADLTPVDASLQHVVKFWSTEEADLAVEVFSALEYGNSMLLDIIVKAWPDIQPDTLIAWSKGYQASQEIADELVFLAGFITALRSVSEK